MCYENEFLVSIKLFLISYLIPGHTYQPTLHEQKFGALQYPFCPQEGLQIGTLQGFSSSLGLESVHPAMQVTSPSSLQ